ncbi:MAG: bifunctional DNA primase/polymerase, partial [Parcubacteria group bacterium]
MAESKVSNLGKAALAYAKRGFRVFPVQPREKIPLGKAAPHGCLDATTDAAKIKAWWSEYPDANVGIACGNGLLVLDIDAHNGGDESFELLESEHGKTPDTPMVLTGGGGRHLYFAYPGKLKNKVALERGIDIRSEGGYVVAPPSIHPSGKRWEWEASSRIDEMEMAPAPQWLVDRLSEPARGQRGQANGTTIDRVDADGILSGVPSGQRHAALFRYAAHLRSQNVVTQSEAEVLVSRAASNCKPPYADEEPAAIVTDVWERYPAGSSFLRDLTAEDVSAPLVTCEDRTVRVEWVAKQILAEARGLKEHSDGRIGGHLRVWTTLPGVARDLRSAQFTFTALRSRTELVSDLAKKVPEVNWDTMIEFLCAKVTDYVQGGEPVEEILAGQQVEPTRFALWPLLIEHHPVILFGQEGTAKSYLALLITYLAVSNSREVEALGLRVDSPLKSLLYLDWEGTADVVRERLNMLQRGMQLPTVPFQYRRCTRPLFSDIDAIKASVNGTPDLIIVDSLIPAAGGDPSSPQVANELFTALRSFGATSLLIGHAPKHTANTAGASVFGSGVFQFLTRSL